MPEWPVRSRTSHGGDAAPGCVLQDDRAGLSGELLQLRVADRHPAGGRRTEDFDLWMYAAGERRTRHSLLQVADDLLTVVDDPVRRGQRMIEQFDILFRRREFLSLLGTRPFRRDQAQL